MVAAARPTHPTFEDLYREIQRLPEGTAGQILEPGVVQRTMGRPGVAHRHTAFEMSVSLRRFSKSGGGSGWWIEIEADLRLLGDRLIIPDLCGFRVERVPERPAMNPITVVPDWCCEVLSPSTAVTDRKLKLPLYAQAGVGWIWLVDPITHSIEVYENVNGRPVLSTVVDGAYTGAIEPFGEGFALESWWWSTPPLED